MNNAFDAMCILSNRVERVERLARKLPGAQHAIYPVPDENLENPANILMIDKRICIDYPGERLFLTKLPILRVVALTPYLIDWLKMCESDETLALVEAQCRESVTMLDEWEMSRANS